MDWTIKNGEQLPGEYQEPNADADRMLDIIDFTAPVKNGPNDVGFDYFYGTPASLDQPPFIHMVNDRATTQPTTTIGIRPLPRYDASHQFDVEYGPAEEGYDPQALCAEMDGAYAIVIPYAEIRSVDYLEDEDFSLGEMLEGVQSRKLWCGRWKNEALGEYELYADPKVKAWAVIQTDSGTTLFNAEENAMTQKLAEAIRD